MQTAPVQFQDFSGGITDNFIDAPLNRYKTADNFLITENKKLFTRYGVGIYNLDYPQVPSGAQRVGASISFEEDLLIQSGTRVYFDDGSSWSTIGDVIKGITVSDYVSYDDFNKQLYFTSSDYSKLQKVYKDELGDYQFTTAGMPSLSSAPSLSGTGGGANNYIYSFHYYYEYNVGTVLNIDAGPVTAVGITQIEEPSTNTVNITGIPVLANGANDNYDIANIKIRIYRTPANGTTSYLLATIDNGITVYDDSTTDATLLTGETIYTTGGVLNNDPPPQAKSIHIVNGAMWYGNIKTGTEIFSNRVLQSVLNDPDSVPVGNFLDFDDEVVGISSYMDRTLIFCKNSVFRVDGNYDELGGSSIIVQKIADTIGCVSERSLIQTPHGVFFASDTGFAYTDGFKCVIISNDFNETYKSLVKTQFQKDHINSTYDRVNNRIYFTAQRLDSINSEADTVYICDARWGINENMSFTTFSGDNLNPTCLVFHDDELIQGDFRGYIMAHREEFLSDARVDILTVPTTWGEDAIIYDYESPAIKPFDQTRAYIPKVIFSAKNSSNLSTQIISNSDIGNRLRSIKPVRWRGNLVWGDPLFVWGQEGFQWGVQGFIEHQRYFHGDDLRCTYKQVQLTNAEVLILDDEALSTVTVDQTAKTVLLDDLFYSWLDDMIGYSIYFEFDNYTEEFEILSHSSSTLVVLDSNGTLLGGGNQKFKVIGKPKNEILSLLNINLLVAPLGRTQDRYSGGES